MHRKNSEDVHNTAVVDSILGYTLYFVLQSDDGRNGDITGLARLSILAKAIIVESHARHTFSHKKSLMRGHRNASCASLDSTRAALWIDV